MAAPGFIEQTLGEKFRQHSDSVSSGSYVSGNLEHMSDDACRKRRLRVRINTFNINGEPLPSNIASMIGVDPDCSEECRMTQGCQCPDVLVFNFQEAMKLSVSRIARDLFSGRHREKHCESLRESLVGAIPNWFVECHAEQMVGLFTIAFCTKSIRHSLQYAQSAIVATGIGGLGNKGAIALRLRFSEASLVFINAHLAASEDELERRNEDMLSVGSDLTFPAPPIHDDNQAWKSRSLTGVIAGYVEGKDGETDPHDMFHPDKESRHEANHRFTIRDHDYLFAAGDLNYRIALEHDEVISLIAAKSYGKLLAHDQLNTERNLGHIFGDWYEDTITFRPTYKFDKTKSPHRSYDTSDKHRTPSYTDRILYHLGSTDARVVVEEYTSHEDILCSDHLPVSLTVLVQGIGS